MLGAADISHAVLMASCNTVCEQDVHHFINKFTHNYDVYTYI